MHACPAKMSSATQLLTQPMRHWCSGPSWDLPRCSRHGFRQSCTRCGRVDHAVLALILPPTNALCATYACIPLHDLSCRHACRCLIYHIGTRVAAQCTTQARMRWRDPPHIHASSGTSFTHPIRYSRDARAREPQNEPGTACGDTCLFNIVMNHLVQPATRRRSSISNCRSKAQNGKWRFPCPRPHILCTGDNYAQGDMHACVADYALHACQCSRLKHVWQSMRLHAYMCNKLCECIDASVARTTYVAPHATAHICTCIHAGVANTMCVVEYATTWPACMPVWQIMQLQVWQIMQLHACLCGR